MPEEENNITCPCCGKQTFKLPAKVSQADMDLFLACLLTGLSYQHTYSLYLGKLSITVSDLTIEDRDQIAKLTFLITLAEKTDNDLRDIYQSLFTRLLRILAVQLINIKIDNSIKKYTPSKTARLSLCLIVKIKDKDRLNQIYKNLIDTEITGNIPVSILDKVLSTFTTHLNALILSGFDDSFYLGIVQGS